MRYFLITLLFTFILIGCGPISPIVIENKNIESYLNSEDFVPSEDLEFNFFKEEGLFKKFLSEHKVEFNLQDVNISSDTLGLTINTSFSIVLENGKNVATGTFEAFGTPYLDNEKGKIYVRNIDIQSFALGEKMFFVTKSLLMRGIEQGMGHYPLYKFDDKNILERIIKSNLKEIKTDQRGVLVYF